MMLELKFSYNYLMGDLGTKYLSCELSFFGLNLHTILLAKAARSGYSNPLSMRFRVPFTAKKCCSGTL